MLHPEVVAPVVLELLKGIQRNPVFADTRLADGTALALQIGHRKSIDLDFFWPVAIAPLEVEQELRAYGPVSLRNRSQRMQSYTVAGVQVDFVAYAYPWLDGSVAPQGLRLASCRDIAAMKLAAITNRGTKKDFVDLVFLLDRFSLSEMLAWYARKFEDGGLFLVLKSLVYFDDAEDDPEPNMVKAWDWPAAKQRIAQAVAEVSAPGTPPRDR